MGKSIQPIGSKRQGCRKKEAESEKLKAQRKMYYNQGGFNYGTSNSNQHPST